MENDEQQLNEQEQKDFYQKLRQKLVDFLASKTGKKHKYADYLLFVPDIFHLLIKIASDPAIDSKSKSLIGATIAYFIFPMDFLPEGIFGFGGFLDDLLLATFVLNLMINKWGATVIEKHWTGDKKLLEVLQNITETSNQLLQNIPVKSIFTKYVRNKSK
ncbi:YkvA family protein [Lysinibacillus sp. NPDC097195]|uniref:YkvA family protein n=1 Tax=Lysinibacillus sp. NPDC097195 TaxID=3364141 RepID=UPI00382C7F2F